MSYTCMIVDDEPLAHDVLLEYSSAMNVLTVVQQCYNAAGAAAYLSANAVDVLFLDIQMPGMNGLRFLESLPQKPLTIITTAFREYALEGFELGVMDYLVKPVKRERFEQAVKRAIEFLDLQKKNESPAEPDAGGGKTFVIKSGTRQISLFITDITHVQGLKDYAIIYAGNKKHVVKGYIKNMEALLPAGYFTRVHKSFIVANAKIKIINRSKIEFDHYQVPVGRLYKKQVEDLL
jgi:DNA-binding LytR/AlgR family response regulator